MPDAVILKGLALLSRIGCTAEERAYPQRLEVDCEITSDLRQAGQSGNLGDTICYMKVRELILALASEKEWALLEELGEQICTAIFERFPRSESIELEMRKFVVSDGEWVGLRLTRSGSH